MKRTGLAAVFAGCAMLLFSGSIYAEETFAVSLEKEPIEGTLEDFELTKQDVVILYTNDVHGGISNDQDYSGSSKSIGYAGLAAVREESVRNSANVTIVDLGDAIQGSSVTAETEGQTAMTLMDIIGYDIRVPGNHEFDYGMQTFLEYAASTDDEFICCNFLDLVTGEPVFDPYKIVSYEVGGELIKVGYVGMCTPEALTKSKVSNFQNEEGEIVYSFAADTNEELYGIIQEAIDAAYAGGADLVIGLGHMGDEGVQPEWSSRAVIENTTGLSAFLDGHAHHVIPGEILQNKDGEDVILASAGTKLEQIGVLKLSVTEDGVTLQPGLVDELTREEYLSYSYTVMDEYIQGVEEDFEYLFVLEGTTPFKLYAVDPGTGERIVRLRETNLGDFLADAYKEQLGTDCAFIAGGNIRAEIEEGEIKYTNILSVLPWSSEVTVTEITGQVLLDILEMGGHLSPTECGGFMHVAGVTYTIDTRIPSSVNINKEGQFVSVDGEYRVKDVMVGGEPLDLEKKYTAAINAFYSKEYGDGMNMLENAVIVRPAEGEEPIIDHDLVIGYLKDLGGVVPDEYKDPYGQGRITILTEADSEGAEEKATEEPAEETAAEETPEETENAA